MQGGEVSDLVPGTRLQETDAYARKGAKQIEESTDRNIKEVTRTLATLVEQHRTKASTENAEAFDRLNRRLDNEVENFTHMVKEVKDLGLKEADESKLLSRLERLGKDVIALKSEQVKVASGLDGCLGQNTNLENLTQTITKNLDQQKEEIARLSKQNQNPGQKEDFSKLSKLESSVSTLEHRLDSTGRLADTLVQECSRKVDKTEVDDIRNGMEKERCKINYFQDKILNIAKVAEGAKSENSTLSEYWRTLLTSLTPLDCCPPEDKLMAEVVSVTAKIQSVSSQVREDTVSNTLTRHNDTLGASYNKRQLHNYSIPWSSSAMLRHHSAILIGRLTPTTGGH